MPTVGVPLFSTTYKNVDEVVLTDNGALQYNGFIDELGGINVRPGEALGIDNGRRVDGLYCWPEQRIVSVEEGNIYLYDSLSTGALVLAYAGSAPITLPLTQSVMCNNDGYTFIASGGRIHYVSPTGAVSIISDPDAPTNVTHVIFIDGYLVANNSNNKFYHADNPDNLSWSALSFASAEANPDKIVAIHVFQRQIYLIGTVTTEIWENDGETPFSRIPGGLIEVGCIAPYSVVKGDNSLMWLGHNRYFVEFAGSNVNRVSTKYDKEIQSYPVVSDCKGGRVDVLGRTYYVFAFPSAGKTLAYEVDTKEWSEWGRWDSPGMSWLPYDFNCSSYDLTTGRTFIGKTAAKLITSLDPASRVDYTAGSSTERVKFSKRTGFINYGTSKRKRMEELRIRAKSGDAAATLLTGDANLMVRWRNNGSSSWCNLKDISLGQIGDTEFDKIIKRDGVFRSRQYELSATDSVQIVMGEAEADFTVLR